MIFQQNHSLKTDYFTVEKSENLTFPMHIHSCFEIVAITDGEMTVTVDSVAYSLKKGDVIFIFPYQVHSMITSNKSSNTLCIFSSRLVSYFYNITKGSLPEKPVVSFSESSLFSLLCSCEDTDDIMKIKGVLYLLCSELIKNTALVVKSKKKQSYLEVLDDIFVFVNENYTESCTLKDVAEKLKYDYSYISKIFAEFVGMSFTRYINMLRISEACYMLKNTDKSVVSVSELCGYSSLRSFNRNFLQIMNMTPTEYKEKTLR